MNVFSEYDHLLDCQHMKCPYPTTLLRKMVRDMKEGETVLLLADDLGTTRDVPKYCTFMDHTLLHRHTMNKPYKFLIKKGLHNE